MTTGMKRALAMGVIVLLSGISKPQPSEGAPAQCPLAESDTRWIQGLLDGWTRASREFLEIDPDPLPRIVLFDALCEFHLGDDVSDAPGSEELDIRLRFNGKPVPLRRRSHDGNVMLPNGSRIPAEIIAVAMPGAAGRNAFLVLALPEVWRRHSGASKDPHLAIRIPSVALHEMIHTRQLPDLRRHISAIGEQFDLPARFDDDVVEGRFGESPEYKRMFVIERDLLYEAVAEPDLNRSITLASEALLMAQQRSERFFVDSDEMYLELEGLFLNMEGLAEWVRFKSHQADDAWPNDDADIIAFLRGRDNSWSQDEGLALMLLLDRMMPDWQRKSLDPTMPSPLELLREAICESRRHLQNTEAVHEHHRK